MIFFYFIFMLASLLHRIILSCVIIDKKVEMSKQDNRGKLKFFLLIFLWLMIDKDIMYTFPFIPHPM